MACALLSWGKRLVLNLPYSPDVPRALIEVVEHHGRRLGLTLAALERIGQSLDLSESFIVASESGIGNEFADAVEQGTALPVPAFALALGQRDRAAS